MQRISIRLPPEVIEQCKALAFHQGLGDWRGSGYQIVIRRALQAHVKRYAGKPREPEAA